MTTHRKQADPSGTIHLVSRHGFTAWRSGRSTMTASVVLASVVLALGACGDDEPDASDQESTASSPTATAAEVEMSQLIADAAGYDDKRVRVEGVADDHGPGIFSLVPHATGTATGAAQTSTEDPSDEVDGLVVVHALGEGPEDGDAVTVTGQVNDSFDVSAVEDALGIDIDDDLVRTLNLGSDDAVLVADDVQTA